MKSDRHTETAEPASASFAGFEHLDVRVGEIVRAEPFPEARKPAYKLWIDFGELGTRTSSAQITSLYAADDLPGQQVVAVVNFPPKRIAGFRSDVLVLGALTGEGVVLLRPERGVPPGSRIA